MERNSIYKATDNLTQALYSAAAQFDYFVRVIVECRSIERNLVRSRCASYEHLPGSWRTNRLAKKRLKAIGCWPNMFVGRGGPC